MGGVVLGDLQIGLQAAGFLVVKAAGIDGQGKVGCAGVLIGGIELGVEPLIAQKGGETRSFATGGEAHNADTLRIDAPLRRVRASEAHGTLRVHDRADGFHRRVALIVQGVAVLAGGHAILHHDRGEADRVQPLGHFRAFEVPSEDGKATTRADQHRTAIRLLLLRQIDMHLRRADMAEFDDLAARDELVLRFGEIALCAGHFRGRSRRCGGPEVEKSSLGFSPNAEHKENDENAQSHVAVGCVGWGVL